MLIEFIRYVSDLFELIYRHKHIRDCLEELMEKMYDMLQVVFSLFS